MTPIDLARALEAAADNPDSPEVVPRALQILLLEMAGTLRRNHVNPPNLRVCRSRSCGEDNDPDDAECRACGAALGSGAW